MDPQQNCLLQNNFARGGAATETFLFALKKSQ
jgi:hypothetical protein